jgi:hypothetical protein
LGPRRNATSQKPPKPMGLSALQSIAARSERVVRAGDRSLKGAPAPAFRPRRPRNQKGRADGVPIVVNFMAFSLGTVGLRMTDAAGWENTSRSVLFVEWSLTGRVPPHATRAITITRRSRVRCSEKQAVS